MRSTGLHMSANKMCFKQEGAISTLSSKTLKLFDQFMYLSSNISSTEIYIYIYIYIYIKLANGSQGRSEGFLFNTYHTEMQGRALFWIAPLTLDPYIIMLGVRQRGINYHFLSLLHDLTCD